MDYLEGKNIIAGICGGIAVYKACDVVSAICQKGAKVQVMMTEAACEFVNPLTLESLAHKKVLTDLWTEPLAHIEEARGADLFVIMPATLNTISKVACGIADNLLTTVISATCAPVLFCPAMDSQMYENSIFQENMSKLRKLGNYFFLEPEEGRLASGRMGKGRFPDKDKILARIEKLLVEETLLEGKKILVTAGPTREMIDPIRCITNRSSGKMGYAIARKARDLGASKVLLISGPTLLKPPSGIEFSQVESAQDMNEVVLDNSPGYDWLVLTAAVADWQPHQTQQKKIKKTGKETMKLLLEKTPDIANNISGKKKKGQILVGFAAETENLLANAQKKLEEKNFDLMVANDVTCEGAGPETDTNLVTLIYKDKSTEELPLMSKEKLAKEILIRLVDIKK